jgi:serine/threonine protein kinase
MPERALFESLSRRDPRRIGPYALLGRLGAGAMGRVYLGRSAASRLVAVKTIKLEFAEEADFRTRFGHEVAAARKVSGAFTAAVVAADPDAEVPWLATSYVPAPSLDRLVAKCGPLPVQAVRWLAAGCAEALESIHDAGLVHRDLKPSNVLVSLDGPRVIDFGLARAVERMQLTATRVAIGTPAYMAPEQARGSRPANRASDVFSLGSTLLYAASGHPPYVGETVTDILVRLATEDPDLSGMPGEVTDIIAACLERDPDRRPTPAALLAHLAPYLDSEAGHEFDSPSLPGSALALIEEYRQGPQFTVPAPESEEESTLPPHVPSTGSHKFPSWHAPRQRRPVITTVLLVGAASALVVLGGLLGLAIEGGPHSAASPPARNGPPPGLPPAPVSGATERPVGPPRIVMNQPIGDGHTNFIVHGSGWRPGRVITIRLAGKQASAAMPIVDRTGTFNYAINQNHEFFPGELPPGRYEVVVTALGGASAEATFTVN